MSSEFDVLVEVFVEGWLHTAALKTNETNKKAAQRNCGPRFLPLTAAIGSGSAGSPKSPLPALL